MNPVKLGISYDAKAPTPPEVASSSVSYPMLYIADAKELEVPKSGTMTIRFKRVGETERIVDGKEKCSYDIEVHEVLDVVPDDPKEYEKGPKMKSAIEALKEAFEGDEED